ncbi:MAG: hypothetical protein AB1705_13775 [Verrucomicrobiota bacterium]
MSSTKLMAVCAAALALTGGLAVADNAKPTPVAEAKAQETVSLTVSGMV